MGLVIDAPYDKKDVSVHRMQQISPTSRILNDTAQLIGDAADDARFAALNDAGGFLRFLRREFEDGSEGRQNLPLVTARRPQKAQEQRFHQILVHFGLGRAFQFTWSALETDRQ